jgi:lipopolysaccharide/colanic/teichoic acid biosynthesis glycosyltransferase
VRTPSRQATPVHEGRLRRDLIEKSGAGVAASALSRRSGRVIKRTLDLVVAVPAGLLVTPVVAAAAAWIGLRYRGTPFFRQDRVGRDGETITVWKIRTMCKGAEAQLEADPSLRHRYVHRGHKLHSHEDPRILPAGRVLRRYSIDELPQVYQVILGSMSLVGPRPVPREELDHLYGADYRQYYEAVRPGLTGLWQISGRNHITGEARRGLDVQYVDDWSFSLDVRVLLRTLPAVLSGHGAH